jgi:hypothetical protein
VFWRRLWILRATRDTLSEQIHWACKGLALGCAQEGTTFVLEHRGMHFELRALPLAPKWQALLLPDRSASTKVALFLDWLGRQYPGPLPRLRIVLKRE